MMRRLVALSLLVAVGAQAQMLCSFETPEQSAMMVASGAKTSLVADHATDGKTALRAVYPGSEKDSWPGISFRPDPALLLKRDMLSFDVFNPSTKPVHLSWRIDDANGKKIFGGAVAKPGTETLSIYLRALAEQLALDKVQQFYLYQRMPREDVTLFFDNFRLADFGDSFTALTYRQVEPAVEPTAEDGARGYQVFHRHWQDFVFPNSRPRAGETSPRLDAFATPGETEPLTFSVVALKALKQAGAKVGDLLAPDGSRIPSDAVSIYPIRCLDKRVTYSSKQFIRNVPVLLERRATVDIAAEEAKRFWLDVRVPADAKPGVYGGAVTFAADGVPECSLPIRVRVLPFSLPEPKDMFFGEYYQGPRMAKTPEEKRVALEQEMRDMRAHGMTSIGLCFGVDTKPATFANGEAKLVFDGSSLFEHCMNLYKPLGFSAPVVLLSDSGQGFATKSEAEFGSARYKEYYQAFWRAMQAECKARNWPELIVQPVDEPGWKDQQAKDRNTTLLKWLKEIPGMRTEQDGPPDGYFRGVAGPYADMWNYNGGIDNESIVAAAKAKGHLIVLYNCDVESYRPEMQRYMAGFFQKRAGSHGCFNWAYMSFSGSPYSDFDFKTGTWMHVYPKWKDEVGGPSIGWVAYREGVDDYRYIQAFEDAATQAATPAARKAAASGQRKLDALLATIDYSPHLRNSARFATKRPVGEGFEVTGPYAVPNGWDFATYDIARWQLAQATMEILGMSRPAEASGSAPKRLLADGRWTSKPDAVVADRVARQVSIPKAEGAIKVDGEFSEDVWKGAARIGEFSLSKGGKPQAQTQAWLFRTDTELCMAVECEEPFTDMMTANIGEDGGQVWKDDCVELFFDQNLNRSTFRQVVVNSLGKVLTVDSTGAKWQPKLKVAAKVLDGKWQVELALPLADLQASSTTFGFNLCRERRPTEVFELSCWSPTGGNFGEPSRFGVASFGASFLTSITLGEGVLGTNSLKAMVTNPTAAALSARLVVACKTAAGDTTRSTAENIALAPGQSQEVAVPYGLSSAGEKVEVSVALEDARTGKRLADQQLSQTVTAPLKLKVTPALTFTSQELVACTVELALAKDLRSDLRLRLSLVDEESGKTVSESVIARLGGDVFPGLLRLGNAEGSYQLRATLFRRDGTEVARTEAPISRVRGPF